MTDGLSTLRDQITKLMSGVGSLITALQSLQNQFGGNTTLGQMGDADRLIGGMRSLGDTLQVTFGNMASNLEWVDPVVIALDGSPYCDSNPVCSTVRDQFRQLQTARNDGTLDKLAGQLQSTGALSNLSQTVSKLTQLMNSLTGSMGSLGLANPGGGGAHNPRWAICNKASIPSPMGADRWPTVCNNWWTRPNGWARTSASHRSFCWHGERRGDAIDGGVLYSSASIRFGRLQKVLMRPARQAHPM